MGAAVERDWESLRRFVNGLPPVATVGTVGVRDTDNPCDGYDGRGYDGTGSCLSDGHYECANCSQLSPNAPRFTQDRAGRAMRLRWFWMRPRAPKKGLMTDV
jgi:hypothetical protein